MVGLMLATLAPPAQASTAGDVGLGMDTNSLGALANAGAPADYASYWVGEWLTRSGWAGVDSALKNAKAAGATPVLYWYYWGDPITPSCVENGCSDRNRAEWDAMTNTLAQKVRDIMGGAPVYIVLENEFNKGGITDAWYAPTFDGYLEQKAKTLKAVPGVKVILGYGSWGEDRWGAFPKAIAASDMIGFQMMRGSTRDSEATYRGADDKIASVLVTINKLSPGKQAFLYDVALSSYPDSTYRTIQAETLKSIMDRRGEYAANGLVGLVYRELRDNPSMGTHNYFGIAEQYWGFRDTYGNAKPSLDVWLNAAKSSPTPLAPPPPAPIVPASFEAEAMYATTGGRSSEPAASGGATWNVWTNGELRQSVNASAGTYLATIVARGTTAAGVAPNMELRHNGARVASWTVAAGALASYSAEVALPQGTSTLAVAFTNDAVINGEDRNLFVDLLRVETPEPQPVPNEPPTASFTHMVSGLRVEVDASASSDPEGAALTYAWDFGDGATATGALAGHDYAATGTYTITLIVSDGESAVEERRVVGVVRPNQAPVASVSVSGKELAWTFDASGSADPDGDALTYAWDFGDGAKATGVRVSHSYAGAGSYTATVVASDPSGASGAASITVSATKAPPAPFNASFTPRNGNNWWVQTSVAANRDLAAVCASVNGGACQPLQLKDWGDWAASLYVPTDARVSFRATATSGESVTSGLYAWPSGAPALPLATATFTPYDGNAWWLQTKVDANQPVKAMCASVNGGACQPLQLQSWGAWAASYHAPKGSKVVFQATVADGQVVKSAPYTWPVK